jgi:ABC-type Fe3+ transport system substrate-binding protein
MRFVLALERGEEAFAVIFRSFGVSRRTGYTWFDRYHEGGVEGLVDCIQVLKGTKHPHAAMLFVDFILSTGAQRMMQAAEYFPSNPNVDLSPSLKPIVPRNAGIPALMLTSEWLEQLTPQSVELYKKYFR